MLVATLGAVPMFPMRAPGRESPRRCGTGRGAVQSRPGVPATSDEPLSTPTARQPPQNLHVTLRERGRRNLRVGGGPCDRHLVGAYAPLADVKAWAVTQAFCLLSCAPVSGTELQRSGWGGPTTGSTPEPTPAAAWISGSPAILAKVGPNLVGGHRQGRNPSPSPPPRIGGSMGCIRRRQGGIFSYDIAPAGAHRKGTL